MLNRLRTKVIESLWLRYQQHNPQMQCLKHKLAERGIQQLTLDHFAVIDLPGEKSGIPFLKQIFTGLGFQKRGCGYLAEKQNDFLWLAEENCEPNLAHTVLPQVVVADFRLAEMPTSVINIITKYARLTSSPPKIPIPMSLDLENQTTKQLLTYFQGRDWPLPTKKEFMIVHEFNELLAWVLIFGRQPNHFTLSVHLMPEFEGLETFHRFVEEEVKLPLNREGGLIKGDASSGIAQGSTLGPNTIIALEGGEITLPSSFVEFVWRYPLTPPNQKPSRWQDYFTGFVAQHADYVIESIFTHKE